METFLSDEAILELAAEEGLEPEGMDEAGEAAVTRVVELANQGVPAAARVLDRVSRALAAVVVNIGNLLNPELLVLDGYPRLVQALMPAARRAARERALPLVGREMSIRAPSLGEKTVLVGAGMLVLERFWQAPVFDIEANYRELAGTRSIGRAVPVVPGS